MGFMKFTFDEHKYKGFICITFLFPFHVLYLILLRYFISACCLRTVPITCSPMTSFHRCSLTSSQFTSSTMIFFCHSLNFAWKIGELLQYQNWEGKKWGKLSQRTTTTNRLMWYMLYFSGRQHRRLEISWKNLHLSSSCIPNMLRTLIMQWTSSVCGPTNVRDLLQW